MIVHAKICDVEGISFVFFPELGDSPLGKERQSLRVEVANNDLPRLKTAWRAVPDFARNVLSRTLADLLANARKK